MTQRLPTYGELVVLPKGHTSEERNVELRRIRKHRVLNLIRECEFTSRAEISRITGYNLPNVSSIVEELVREGLVTESEAVETPRGRRPVPISLNKNAAMVMGIDIGKSQTVAILVNLRGETLHRLEKPTPTFANTTGEVDWAVQCVKELVSGNNGTFPPLAGIGVGIPGLVRSSDKPDYEHASSPEALRAELSKRFGVPVLVDNDARMMALGSIWFGHGREYSTFVLMTIAMGLGSGIVINRRITRGAFGTAGEIGHLPIGEPGIPCYCGGTGCLENTASIAGLLRLAEKYGLGSIDLASLASLARTGNASALLVFDEFATALARGIAVAANLLNPEAIVLSGHGAEAADLFLEKVKQRVRAATLPKLMEPPEIQVSELGDNTGCLGASAAVLHHIFNVAHMQLEEVF